MPKTPFELYMTGVARAGLRCKALASNRANEFEELQLFKSVMDLNNPVMDTDQICLYEINVMNALNKSTEKSFKESIDGYKVK